jgi:hypothetical protein
MPGGVGLRGERYTEVVKDPNVELSLKYAREGHPSIEELAAAQGVKFPQDITELMNGNFWPEDESIDDFLEFIREQRGHRKTDT